MISVQRVTTGDPMYRQGCTLREDVLLSPLGYTIERFRAEYPAADERGEHFVAVFRHPVGPRVVGTAILMPNYPQAGVGKVMQVAVAAQRRGEGIGTLMMVAIERRAFGELGLTALMCHAQLRAVAFYDRLGWHADSEIFEEAGIEHRRMVLRASGGPG